MSTSRASTMSLEEVLPVGANMQRRSMLVGAGMKMYLTRAELEDWLAGCAGWTEGTSGVELFFLPSFPYLPIVAERLHGSKLGYGAQNMHWEDRGAYTGEVSPIMLKDFGVRYVELGHAERRRDFNETNVTVNLKVRAALSHALVPVICVGEDQQDAPRADSWLRDQVLGALEGVEQADLAAVVIAYEPVWAIGVTSAAAPDYVFERHRAIRVALAERYGSELARAPRIIYGGSVTTDNASELLHHEEVQGLFVGRAALDAGRFRHIVSLAQDVHRGRPSSK